MIGNKKNASLPTHGLVRDKAWERNHPFDGRVPGFLNLQYHSDADVRRCIIREPGTCADYALCEFDGYLYLITESDERRLNQLELEKFNTEYPEYAIDWHDVAGRV